jgi:hypothetical protein
MLTNSHLGAVSDGKQRGWRSWAWWLNVSWKMACGHAFTALDRYAPRHSRVLYSTIQPYITPHHNGTVISSCVRVCPPLSCGTERTTPACCACLATRNAKCGLRLSNSYGRPTKPSWRPTATRAPARYPPAALHSWGPCHHYTSPSHTHQIWWMCIDDCDARVRAVACRRLHAAYVHDTAIGLRWKLPAIVLRLDQVVSLALTANEDRAVSWRTELRPPGVALSQETDPSALMSLLLLLATFMNHVASYDVEQRAECAASITSAGYRPPLPHCHSHANDAEMLSC